MTIVDDIRDPFLASLEDDVAKGRRDNALMSLRERGVSKDLIRQQYSGRYPFELLQNANDAVAAEDGRGRALFELTQTALIVADDGSGFQDKHVKAICTLGDSTKDPSKSVGYKGLGFKSVGEITDSPQILSHQLSFGFSADRARAEIEKRLGVLPSDFPLPTYAVPFTLEDGDLGNDQQRVLALREEGYTTIVRLPFMAGVTREVVEAHVMSSLLPRLLLFLPATKRLEVLGTTADFVADVERERAHGNAEYALLQINGEISTWLHFTERVPVPNELVKPMGKEWAQVAEAGIGVAVPLENDDRPATSEAFPLHVYFPTDENSGFPFITQADWALHLDRRQLANTPEASPYNTWLSERVAEFVVTRMVPELADRYAGTARHLPALGEIGPSSGAGAALRSLIMAGLTSAEIVPVTSGSLAKPQDAAVLPANTDVAAAHALARDGAFDAVALPEADQDQLTRSLLLGLGTPVLTNTQLFDALRLPDQGTAEQYYRFLVGWDERIGRQKFLNVMRGRSFVLTKSGDVLAPTAPKARVFFPRGTEGAALPEGLPVPIAKVPAIEGLDGLLTEAGVQDFRWRELVMYYLVPILSTVETPESDRERAFEGIRAYLRDQRTGDQQVRDAVGQVLLPSRDGRGHLDGGLRRADELYFDADWTGDSSLNVLYGPFGKPDFLGTPPPDDAGKAEEWRELYAFLGVADLPRVLTSRQLSRDTWMTGNLNNHPHRSDPLWPGWWNSLVENGVTVCPSGLHGESQQLRMSHHLDRFHDIVATAKEESDLQRVLALWRALARGWVEVYTPALQATFHCQHGGHAGKKDRSAPSLFLHSLRATAWVPCVLADVAVIKPPGEIWRRGLDTPKIMRDFTPTLADDMDAAYARTMADTIGITDAARALPDELVRLLIRLAELSDAAEADVNRLRLAARWAMRTLNQVLSARHDPHDGEIRLIAQLAGNNVFVSTPLVAHDPFVREAFAADLPVIDVDTDLQRVFTYFRLVDLDSAIEIIPHDLNPLPQHKDRLAAAFDEAKPLILALIRDVRPYEADNARGRLGRLDFQVCERLELEYRYGEIVKRLRDPTSYIAVRIEALRGATTRAHGTAHLEVERQTGMPNWDVFGPQLAQYLRVDVLGDAFTTILSRDEAGRRQYLHAKRIHDDDVAKARDQLGLPIVDDDMIDIHGLVATQQMPATQGGFTEDAAQDSPSLPAASQAGTEASADVGAAPDLPPLELSSLEVKEVQAAQIDAAKPSSGGGSGGIGVPGIPFLDSEALKQQYGRRGEEAALTAERRRVAKLGLDPAVVFWRSDTNPYAAWDIESIDAGGRTVYIEVKSTSGSEPDSEFLISRNELMQALRHRENYVIYRVTDVASARPKIYRFADPLARLSEGTATLAMADARMRLGADGKGL